MDFLGLNISEQVAQGGDASSIANQALSLAQSAMALAQAVQNSIPARRGNAGSPIPLPANDSISAITWSPDMPDTNYMVNVIIYGPNSIADVNFTFFVLDSSRTVNSCQIKFLNMPAGCSYNWTIEDVSA